MVKIKYIGSMQACNVRVPSGRITNWKQGEVRDIAKIDAKAVLVQDYFVLDDGEELVIEETTKEEIKEMVEEEPKMVEEEPEVIENSEGEIPFDYENALKDDLLDYTARHDIEADYNNTVKELRDIIREYLND